MVDVPNGGRGGESIDAVLRQLLRQGRLDPPVERLASQGIDRLKTFLAGEPAPAPAEPVVEEAEIVQVEVVHEEAEVRTGPATLRHVIPLPDGSRAEVLVPERLSRADADRIAAFLSVLVIEEPSA
ncbi:MAG: hypothetical protein ACRYF3_14510 [Janthinobacterium lividum]